MTVQKPVPPFSSPTRPWHHPDLSQLSIARSIAWKLGSFSALFACGLLSKFWLKVLNKTEVHGYEKWIKLVEKRGPGKALLTLCNHTSNIDDPLVFGILPMRLAFRPSSLRWGMAADNICFTKPAHAKFCSLVKTVPVYRGDGVYQKGMDFLLDRINHGDWAHIFPEGKVNMAQEWMRIKWGVGRLVAEAKVPTIVLPFWHEGLHEVLPMDLPYRPRTGKKVTIVIGDPINSMELIEDLHKHDPYATNELNIRKAVTDRLQEELRKLRLKTRKLHYGSDYIDSDSYEETSYDRIDIENRDLPEKSPIERILKNTVSDEVVEPKDFKITKTN